MDAERTVEVKAKPPSQKSSHHGANGNTNHLPSDPRWQRVAVFRHGAQIGIGVRELRHHLHTQPRRHAGAGANSAKPVTREQKK